MLVCAGCACRWLWPVYVRMCLYVYACVCSCMLDVLDYIHLRCVLVCPLCVLVCVHCVCLYVFMYCGGTHVCPLVLACVYSCVFMCVLMHVSLCYVCVLCACTQVYDTEHVQ